MLGQQLAARLVVIDSPVAAFAERESRLAAAEQNQATLAVAAASTT